MIKKLLIAIGVIILVLAIVRAVSGAMDFQPALQTPSYQNTVTGTSLQGSSPSLQPATIEIQGAN